MSTTPDHFPTEVAGLPVARASELIELADGGAVRPADRAGRPSRSATRPCGCSPTTARSPGRRSRCAQGSEIIVHVANRGDLEATVHWHGLRLENRYDGTHETQAPIAGRRDASRTGCTFPDPGRLLVSPAHPRGLRPGDGPLRQHPRRPGRAGLLAAGPPRARPDARRRPDRGRADRAVQPHPRRRTWRWAASATCCSSAGEPDLSLDAKRGEVVRFYFTNTANTRVFNVALPGARMKLVGGDSGHCRARGVRRGGRPRSVGARRRRRALRRARRARARASNPRADLSARRDHGR